MELGERDNSVSGERPIEWNAYSYIKPGCHCLLHGSCPVVERTAYD